MTSRELYYRLLGYVRPYWRQFVTGLLAMAVLGITEPAIAALMKPLLDGTFVERDPDYMFWTPIAMLALFLLRGLMNFASSYAFGWVSGKLVLDLRRLMFRRIMTLGTPYFDANSTGNIISKVTFNVSQVTAAATNVLTTMVRDSFAVIGLLVYMFYLHWKLSLVVLLLMPTIVIVVRVLAKRLRGISRRLQDSIGDMTHLLEEGVRGHKVVKIYGGEGYERDRFDKLANWVRRLQMKMQVAGSIHLPLVEFIGALVAALLIYLGTHQTETEQLTVGTFVSLITAIALLFSPIKRLTRLNQPLQRGLAAAETIFGLTDEPPEPDTGKLEINRVEGRVTFEDVRFRYPESTHDALKGISFEVQPGTTVALVGHSGGGKSTIANLIPRLYVPTGGRILFDGVDIQELRLAALRRNIAYVGQESILFDDTVGANIAYGAPEEVGPEEIERAAEDAHAMEYIERLPYGMETRVGEAGVRLSGGQRQRLAIARALIKDAPVLLLDEATSALDATSEHHVQQALYRLTESRTTIVIAHRLSTIKHADRILVIQDGRIVEDGSHDELLRREGAYFELYQSQFNREQETA
jgi:subfamily B ATP-binding cassette protein MsbA